MVEPKTFECRKCGKREEAEKAPECCGQRMTPMPLEVCTSAPSAEHSRFSNDDEPCDDSRGS